MSGEEDDNAWREPDTPCPRRWRWTLRLGAAYVVLVVGFACVYGAWIAHARHRWATTIASIRQRGEPAIAEDLVVEPVAQEDDAAPLLTQAANGVADAFADARVPYESMRDGILPQTDDQRRSANESVRKHERQLALVRAARAKSRANWGVRPISPLLTMQQAQISPQRELCEFLTLAAVMRHDAGDDAAALEHLRDILHVSTLLEGGRTNFLVAHETARMTAWHAIDFLDRNAASLDLSPDPARVAARGLIADLLDERAPTEGWRGAWIFERVNAADIYPSYLAKAWCHPMWRLDTVRRIETMELVTRAAAFQTYPQAKPLVPAMLPATSNVDTRNLPEWRRPFARAYPPRLYRTAHLISDLFLDAERRFPLEFVSRLYRREAAVRLACRLYEAETGHLPQRWGDLAPAYFPQAPADPFTSAGEPLRFAPMPKPGVVFVYSVGMNGVDEGGDETSTNPKLRPGFKPQPLERRDIAFRIDPHRPRSPARPDQAQDEEHRGQ